MSELEKVVQQANEQMAIAKGMAERGEFQWQTLPTPQGAVSYQGMAKGYIITVMQAPVLGQGMTTKGMMAAPPHLFIGMTDEDAKFFFAKAAEALK